MIIVTGATGKLGSQIVEHLLDVVPVERIGVSVRDPDKARHLEDLGVRVRQGDFACPGSLVAAFEGAEQLMLVSSNARAHGGDTPGQHRAVIAAAKAAGARRIVYSSHMAASAASAFPPMHDHAATEDMLRESGIAWTALRNGFYAGSVPMFLGDAASTGILSLPQDGKMSWTAHADLAAAAAQILAQEGRFEGPTPSLTASEALDFSDIAAILGDVLGRPIKRRVISDDEQVARMTALGTPPGLIAITLGMYRASRKGEFAEVDPTLAKLIGREPVRLRALLSR